MRYVMLSRVQQLKYEFLCTRTEHQRKAAKAALARQCITARVPIGRHWFPWSVPRGLHNTGRRRGILIRAIARFDAKHPGIAMCIAILTALVYFHLASDPGKSEPTIGGTHVASTAN